MKTSILSSKFIKGLIATAFWLLVWCLLAFIINKEIFLPFPHTVFKRFLSLGASLEFWKTVGVSLARIIIGYLSGVLLGFFAAIVTYKSPLAEAIISPAVRIARATPVASFILLAYLWLNNDTIPIFIALLMVLPIVWQNVLEGLKSRDIKLKEMAKVFKIPPMKRFLKITFPEIRPYFYSGALTSLGLAWKSGIAAEVISFPKTAIGREMNDARMVLETSDVLVWTVAVVLLSLALEGIFKLLFKKEGESND